jgi:hypothetical protein
MKLAVMWRRRFGHVILILTRQTGTTTTEVVGHVVFLHDNGSEVVRLVKLVASSRPSIFLRTRQQFPGSSHSGEKAPRSCFVW